MILQILNQKVVLLNKDNVKKLHINLPTVLVEDFNVDFISKWMKTG